MSPGDQVKHQAPKGAHFYRLVNRSSSGAQRTYPQDRTSFFFMNNAPPSLAPGTYDIIYFNIECQQLDSVGKQVVYTYQHSEDAQAAQISLFAEGAAQPAASAKKPKTDSRRGPEDHNDEDQGEEDEEEEDEGEEDDEDEGEEEDEGDEEEEDDELDLESEPTGGERPFSYRSALQRDQLTAKEETRHIRMLEVQQRTDRHNQRQIRSSMYAREVGETHQLNAMMRREVVEANRIAALSNKRAFDELGRYREANAALRDDFQRNQDAVQQTVEKTVGLLDFVVEKAAEKLAAPPPPSTDFTGLGQSAIEMAGKVLLALLTRSSAAPLLPPASQPAIPAPANSSASLPAGAAPNTQQTPNTSAAPAAASSAQQTPGPTTQAGQAPPSSPPAGQPESPAPSTSASAPAPDRMHPALVKLAAKFSHLGEIELARRMATPDGWKLLFDEIAAEMDPKPQAVTAALEEKK